MTRLSAPAIARSIARELLKAGCVLTQTQSQAQAGGEAGGSGYAAILLPSGWVSPVYMDCRRIIAYPALRRLLVKQGLEQLREAGALEGLDAVVGAEASGIALAAWMADALDLPLHYVRKKCVDKEAGDTGADTKSGGKNPAGRIEGALRAGERVLLVDDLMAGGQSKLRFCQALAAAGARVEDLFIIFDYGSFPTHGLLSPVGLRIHALACWRDVLDVVLDTPPDSEAFRQQFSPAVLKQLQDFLDDPAAWSAAHGGRAGYQDEQQAEQPGNPG